MIIKIGEVEWHDLKRQLTMPSPVAKDCPHHRLRYIEHGELLVCLDCDKQVSAIWALRLYFTQHQMQEERRSAQQEQLKKDEARLVTHRAALAIQDAWRKKKLTPTCPHCHKGIEPPDGFGRSGGVNPKYYRTAPLLMKPTLALVERGSDGGA